MVLRGRWRAAALEWARWSLTFLSLPAGTASLRELVRATKVEGARLRRVLRELAARGYILRTVRTAA